MHIPVIEVAVIVDVVLAGATVAALVRRKSKARKTEQTKRRLEQVIKPQQKRADISWMRRAA